ncbi:DDE-type integrase/transposase/recombinase, partial [Verrucomicrobiota bacterium]
MNADDIPLPQDWPQHVRSAILHIVSLAYWAITCAHSWAANSGIEHIQSADRKNQKNMEITLLSEHIRLLHARIDRISPSHRPYYTPTERMAILELRAARGWNLSQTAENLQVEPETIASWMKRVDEQGPQALIRLPEPINKFPAFVQYIVQRLKVLCPAMGKKKIAEILTRAGLSLCSTTVSRFLKSKTPEIPDPVSSSDLPEEPNDSPPRVVTARHPNHVWHVDLTVVPTRAGFWIPWIPWALPQVWPFCWWIAVATDHFSRKAIGFAVFKKQPTSLDVRSFLGRAMGRNKTKPKYIICDKGTQFWCDAYKKWCKRKKVKPRYGAVGKYGSIAIVERFIRSMKDECTRRIVIPLNMQDMRREIYLYTLWYNELRPHQALQGRTPHQAYHGLSPPQPTFNSFIKKHKDAKLQLHVSYLEDRNHLPIIQLR